MERKKSVSSIVGILVAVILGGLVAWAGSQQGATVGSMPVFALVICYVFAVQWLAFVPSYLRQTERFYDITGSFTYVSAIVLALVLSDARPARSLLLSALVIVWAGRLGTFLFRRVLTAGKDDRFDQIKRSFSRLLMTWTLQGLWVSLTLAAALAAVASGSHEPLGAFAFVGLALWVIGFAFEAVADYQKSRFRSDPASAGTFIASGLWKLSRHPNYFGEIVLWIGVALIAVPVLRGWQFVTLVSPVFVYLLLSRVSGIPLLEKKAEAKWGGQHEYETYKAQTPVLVPFLGRRR